MREPPVVIAADVHVKEVNAHLDEVFHVLQRLRDGAAAVELLEGFDLVHALAICLVECKGEVNAVHDGVVWADAVADFLHHIEAEALPVGVFGELSVIESGICHLLQQIALVTVEVDAVYLAGLCVRRRLSRVFDDPSERMVGKAHTGQLRDVEVRVEGRGHRELFALHKAGRGADAAKARRELDEKAAAVAVAVFSDGAPAGHDCAAAADAGHHDLVIELRNGRVDAMTDGGKAGGDEARAALGAGGEVFDHLRVGTAALLAHHEVPHRGHDDAVFDLHFADLNGRKHGRVGPKLLRHLRGVSDLVFAAVLKPVAKSVRQLLDWGIRNAFLQFASSFFWSRFSCSSFMPSTASHTGFHSQARQSMLTSKSAWLSADATAFVLSAMPSSAA